jgi:triacylglycerol lipase
MNLVFASGFLVPQSFFKAAYFRGLKERFEAMGHKTAFPEIPPLGSVEARAAALAEAIRDAYPQGPVHVIAHSMGGLDSRFLIGRNLHGLAEPGRIVSLSTLSTPHRGSPVADLLAGPSPDAPQRLLYEQLRAALAPLGVETGALAHLTSDAAARVPDAARTHPHIRYRSYFASGRPGPLPTCLALAPTYHYLLAATGQPNDGVVTLASAQYGEFQTPNWPCDHVDMVGHNLDTASLGAFKFDHFAAFDALIGGLAREFA